MLAWGSILLNLYKRRQNTFKQVCSRYRCVLAFDNQEGEECRKKKICHVLQTDLFNLLAAPIVYLHLAAVVYIQIGIYKPRKSMPDFCFICQVEQHFQMNKSSEQLYHAILPRNNVNGFFCLGWSDEAWWTLFIGCTDSVSRSRLCELWGKKDVWLLGVSG